LRDRYRGSTPCPASTDTCWQARVDREAGATDEIGLDAGRDGALKDIAKNIMIAETFVACAREGGMIGDLVFDAEATEPAVGEVELNLAVETAPRSDREHVAEDEHPDHQLRIDRWPAAVGIVRGELGATPRQVENFGDPADLMVVWYHRLEFET
jgi:hypothetical protein